jgi:uncharacterized protein
VVGLLGPRQVGKTTLARALARGRRPVAYFDLEDPADLARLADPALALGPLRGLVVIDEFQRRPDLLPVLRVLADRPRRPARFLVLGSASPDLIRGSSETLAGRIAYHELSGFSLAEVNPSRLGALWLRGGFPRSFLARTEPASWRWRQQLIRTFLERDVPSLGLRLGADTLQRFWAMLAHYHAQVWNASELGRAFGVADTTVRGYLDLLAWAFMVRLLLPWSENLGKRQVKAPKVYLRDTGLLHALLGIRTTDDLERHPKVGASWEGFMLSEVIQRLGAAPPPHPPRVLLLGHPRRRRTGSARRPRSSASGIRVQANDRPGGDTLHARGPCGPQARTPRCAPRRRDHVPARAQDPGGGCSQAAAGRPPLALTRITERDGPAGASTRAQRRKPDAVRAHGPARVVVKARRFLPVPSPPLL